MKITGNLESSSTKLSASIGNQRNKEENKTMLPLHLFA